MERGKQITNILANILHNHKLPTEDEIFNISHAKTQAIEIAASLGMELRVDNNISSALKAVPMNTATVDVVDENDIEDIDDEPECAKNREDVSIDKSLQEDLSLLNCDVILDKTELPENGPFIYDTNDTNENSRTVIIRKSTLCWLLSNSCTKLSSDRLQQVQDTLTMGSKDKYTTDTSHMIGFDVEQSEYINIGQWCAFTEAITKKQYSIVRVGCYLFHTKQEKVES